jgi:SseB protein N-terminal domain
MSSSNDVRNVLEEKLLAAQESHISSDELLEVLLVSQVFMPVQDEKPMALNIQRSTRAQPLALSAEDGTPILVLFSSPERAKPFLQDFPGYTGGILESFQWVLARMGTGYGIALNPGSEVGFDMEPETVTELAQRVMQEDEDPAGSGSGGMQ